MPELFDSHAHIQGHEFEADLEAILERARSAGVTSILVPAVDLQTAERALAIAARHEGLTVAAGYHPHEASHLDGPALARLEVLLAEPAVVAVGEIGLDFYRMHSPREVQVAAIEAMLELAAATQLPVVIHCREAGAVLYPMLESWAARVAPAYGENPLGVMHYFSGDVGEARRLSELGFLISIHTSVTHPKAEQLRAVAAALPVDSLVIETDSPYGAPQAYRGKRNEPAFVAEAASRIASVRGISVEEVATATTANARRLFRPRGARPAPQSIGAAI